MTPIIVWDGCGPLIPLCAATAQGRDRVEFSGAVWREASASDHRRSERVKTAVRVYRAEKRGE